MNPIPAFLTIRARIALCAATLACATFSAAAAVPRLLNYQGRVSVSGQNFTGSGQFKFALVDAAGTEAYWKTTGVPGAIVEPAAGLTLAVDKDHYSLMLGDTSLSGNMQELPPDIFSQHSDVYLRVCALERLRHPLLRRSGRQRLLRRPAPVHARAHDVPLHETMSA